MDRAVQKPFGLDSPRCNLSLLFQALVALSYNVLVSPTPPRLTGVERVLDNSYLRLGQAD